MSGVYLDASALSKLLIVEQESAVLRSFLRQHPTRFTNRVAEVEVARAVRRLPGAAKAPLRTAFAGVEVLELDAAIATHAGTVPPSGLRALDAIHLASAMALAPDLDAFVTYDLRQADAARAAGLMVVSPGQPAG